jgi:hypothetical protein
VKPADPNAITTQILKTQSTQQLQYATTHPDEVLGAYKSADGKLDLTVVPKNKDGSYDFSKVLTPDGQKNYYAFVNNTIFGNSSDNVAKFENGQITASQVKSDPALYDSIAKAAPAFTAAHTPDGKQFSNAIPSEGTVFIKDNKLYQAGGSGSLRARGMDGVEFFWGTDLKTGETTKIIAGE